MKHLFFLLLLISVYSCTNSTQKPTSKETVEKELSMEHTKWNAQFYIHSNFYHFGMNGQGYSDDGQVAWSCPVDCKAKHIPENKILYAGPQKFRYQVKKDTLTITYLNRNEEILDDRVFVYRKEEQGWISVHTYTYGSEFLKQGKRKEFFDEPFRIID